ncbi:hypothetical protein ACP4J4_11925 [Aureimonas ureilytica]|uniref:hypothetical protein n=1 Tax=Aureimonas ureilytica TaxID=401562 RepID=UPI003CED577C
MDDILARLADAARSRYALACEHQASLLASGTASADDLAEAANFVRETGAVVDPEYRARCARLYATLAALDYSAGAAL